jgi:hypothetical protein
MPTQRLFATQMLDYMKKALTSGDRVVYIKISYIDGKKIKQRYTCCPKKPRKSSKKQMKPKMK